MSLAMRQARFAVGDPGLFGFLGKAAGSVLGIASKIIPGPAGALAGAASGLLTPKPVSVAKAGAAGGYAGMIQNAISVTRTAPGGKLAPVSQPLPVFQSGGSGVSIGPGGVQIGTFGAKPMVPAGTVTGPLVGSPSQTACVAGHHMNKTRYYSTRYGVVEKGTVCVKNRRRNPLNPRALSRAMSRVKSAQKAVKCLQLFAGPAARASAKGGGKTRSKGRCGGKCR